ncbi:SPOR domain-containing protein [Betaproteobacteria bacterium LSUCC0117]|nr:SPOR domain-containing protein [Betaproteobacteria bacterium LSUCC0117]
MNNLKPQAQQGGTFLGLVIGVLLGLGISLAVAVYVTKVPIPFVDRGVAGSAKADNAEMARNKNWNPNAAVITVEPPKNLAGVALPEGVDPPPIPSDAVSSDADIPAPAVMADPLGTLALAKLDGQSSDAAEASANTGTNQSGDAGGGAPSTEPAAVVRAPAPAPTPVQSSESKGVTAYIIQAGAFIDVNDAEAQRAKLAIMGVDVRVSVTEKDGVKYFRVRSGPFRDKASAQATSKRLMQAGVDNTVMTIKR